MNNFKIIVVLLFVFLLGCSQDKAFTISDKTINIKSSDKFVIELDEDHSNGENWMLTEDFDPNQLQYTKSVFIKSDNKGKGKVKLYFEALSTANINLHFKLIRYKDSVDAHQIHLIIR
jgi:Chagasin family peptidase inhibitor I42